MMSNSIHMHPPNSGSVIGDTDLKCSHHKFIQTHSILQQGQIKQICKECGCFISQANKVSLKDTHMTFEPEMSPIEIYEHLILDEDRFSNSKQWTDYTMPEERNSLITKIFDFGDKLKQRQVTIHLACTYLDSLLFKYYAQEKQLQAQNVNTPQSEKQRKLKLELRAIMSLMVAAKYDELDDHIPLIREIQKVARFQYQYRECVDEENAIIVAMNWNLHVITPLHIVQSLLSIGVVFEDDLVGGKEVIGEHALRRVKKFAEFFADYSVKQWEMQSYKPSIVALSCILCARKVTNITPLWNPILQEITTYTFEADQIQTCSELLYSLYKGTSTPNQLVELRVSKTERKSVLECNQNVVNENSQPQFAKSSQKQGKPQKKLGICGLDESLIDMIPTISNNAHQRMNTTKETKQFTLISHRASASQVNLKKVQPLHTVLKNQDLQKIPSKKNIETLRINKENQKQLDTDHSGELTNNAQIHLSLLSYTNAPKSVRLNNNTCQNKTSLHSLKLQPESVKSTVSTCLTSQGPISRCTNSTLTSNTNAQMKQRNQSETNLNTLIMAKRKKEQDSLRVQSKYTSNNNTYMSQQPTQSARSSQNNSLIRKASFTQNQNKVQNKQQLTVSKSSRYSMTQNKIDEIRNKYQSDQTIYEKGNSRNGTSTTSIYQSMTLQNRTQLAQLRLQQERSNSECSLERNPSQYQTVHEERKATIVMEEDEDRSVDSNDKTMEDNVTDITQPPNEGDESTVIKMPIQSKKSKSLENINKKLKSKVLEKAIIEVQKNYQNAQVVTRNLIISQKESNQSSTVDLFSNHLEKAHSSVQDKQNISISTMKGHNYLKKNVNYVSTLTQSGYPLSRQDMTSDRSIEPTTTSTTIQRHKSTTYQQKGKKNFFRGTSQKYESTITSRRQSGHYSKVNEQKSLNSNKSLASIPSHFQINVYHPDDIIDFTALERTHGDQTTQEQSYVETKLYSSKTGNRIINDCRSQPYPDHLTQQYSSYLAYPQKNLLFNQPINYKSRSDLKCIETEQSKVIPCSRTKNQVTPVQNNNISTKFKKFQSRKPVKKNEKQSTGGNSLLEQVLLKKTQYSLNPSKSSRTENGPDQSMSQGALSSFIPQLKTVANLLNASKEFLGLNSSNITKTNSQLNISAQTQSHQDFSKNFKTTSARLHAQNELSNPMKFNETRAKELIVKEEIQFKKVVSTFLGGGKKTVNRKY